MKNDEMVRKEIERLCAMFDENGDFFSDDFKNELFEEVTTKHDSNEALSIVAKIECGATIDSAIQNICN